MRSRLILIAVAVIGSAMAQEARAAVYMTVEDAQRLIFPGVALKEHFVTIDQDQYTVLIREVGIEPYRRKVRAWRSDAGDWFIIDQVTGRNDWITYAIGINAQGKVRQIEILECLDNYDGITEPAWRSYFRNKARNFPLDAIPVISGSTLSSEQMAAGVRRILATVALILEPSAQGRTKP